MGSLQRFASFGIATSLKKTSLVLVLIVFFDVSAFPQTGTWVTESPMPTGVSMVPPLERLMESCMLRAAAARHSARLFLDLTCCKSMIP